MSPQRALLIVIAAFALTVVVGSPGESSGRTQAIGVSRDGDRFGPVLTEQLFDSSVRWVPGDVREARFWVRNQAEQPGDLSIDVVTPDRTGLVATGQLTVSARVGDGAWRVLEDGAPGSVVTARDVASAQEVPVDVRVALASSAVHRTEGRSSDLEFRVVRADARSPAPAQAIGGPPWWTPPLGAPLLSLLLAGLLLLLLAIRDRPHRSQLGDSR